MAGVLAEPTQESRRETILAAAGALFASKGVAATTMRDLSQATGLLAGSLYHYFDSKDAIVDEIVSRSLDKLLASFRSIRDSGDAPPAKFVALVRASFASLDDDPAASMIYLKEREHLIRSPRFAYLEASRIEIDAIWMEVLRMGVADGSFRDDIDPLVFYRFAASALWWTAGWHAASGKPLAALADDFVAIHSSALRPR